MQKLIEAVEAAHRKKQVVEVRSGDTVRVHQRIKEGNKERVQVFEGLVIATKRQNSLTNSITVRRMASGVGVEKSFMMHSPLVEKVEVVKRSKVRRNKLNYMKSRAGKSARLDSVEFDRDSVNTVAVDEPEEVATEEAPVEEPTAEEKPAEEAPAEAEAPAEDEKKSEEAAA